MATDSRVVGGVLAGSSHVSWSIVLRRVSDSLEYTGRTAATIQLSYFREGGVRISVPTVDLGTPSSPWVEGGVKEVDALAMPGTYRIDWPDAAFATGANWVQLTALTPGGFTFNERVPLTTFLVLSGPAPGGLTAGTATVLDLLTNALLGIRVHRMGAPLPPEMADHALGALNRMLETWTVGRRLVYRAQELVFLLTHAMTYTIGPGGDINTSRPSAIRAGFTRLGETDYPYDPITQEHYTAIGSKSQGGLAPSVIYYEIAMPLGVLHVWPVSSGELHLLVDQPLGPLVLGDSLSIPPGYEAAMQLALGKQLAPTYGQTLDQAYLDNWREAETALRRQHHQIAVARVSIPSGRRSRDNTYIYHGGM